MRFPASKFAMCYKRKVLCQRLSEDKAAKQSAAMIKTTSGIILLYLLRSTLCIPFDQFYPFGGNTVDSNQRLGDGNSITSLEQATDNLYYFYEEAQFIITVSCLFYYLKYAYSYSCKHIAASFLLRMYIYTLMKFLILQVSVDGAIFFGQGTDTNYVPNDNSFPLAGGRKFLAPFWADVDTRAPNGGDVWYRQTTDQALLDRANTQIRNAFPLQPQFTATNLIIATWDSVGYFDSKDDKVIKINIIYFLRTEVVTY